MTSIVFTTMQVTLDEIGWNRPHCTRGSVDHVRRSQLRERGRAEDVLHPRRGLRGHELHPRVSDGAPRGHLRPGLLPRDGLSLNIFLSFQLINFQNQCHVDIVTHTSAPPNHQEVLDAAAMKENDLRKFIAVLIEKLSPHLQN